MSDKAIVTLLIGERTAHEWKRWFARTWVPYAERHGYEIVVLTDPIDRSPRARTREPHWQKLLTLEHPRVRAFERVVWLDHDILINPNTAPCIVSHHGCDRIGMVSEKTKRETVPAYRDNLARRWGEIAGVSDAIPDRYRRAGLPGDVDDTSNAGVIVLRPDAHAPVLREVYETYEENDHTSKEEVPLCYHLFKHGLVEPLDPRFNRLWAYEMAEHYPHLLRPDRHADHTEVWPLVSAAWHNNWFLHFTADKLVLGDDTYRVRDDVRYVIMADNVLSLRGRLMRR